MQSTTSILSSTTTPLLRAWQTQPCRCSSLRAPLPRRMPHSRNAASQPLRAVAVAEPAPVAAPSTPWWEKGSEPSNMKTISSVEDLIIELSQARDRLIVVDFFARWCGSCKALYPKLCRITEENPEALVLKVNFDDNKQLCKALGVKVLPFFQFYRGSEGRVAAFSASVARVQRLRDALAEHSSPRCSLGSPPIISELRSLLRQEDGVVLPGPPTHAEQHA